MKTKLIALLLAAALALTLAACGERDAAGDTPLPDEPPEPAVERPAADDEWEVLHADDVLLHEEPFTLCEGRTGVLQLYGRQNGEGARDCGVSRILLQWDNGSEQELRTADISDDVWCTDGYTNCWTADGGLVTGDYNFDGYRDIGLQIDTPAYNLPYYYWFYDAETDCFAPYRSWTCQLEIDEENEACICQWHVTPEYYTDTYRPDGKGGLYLAQRNTERYTDSGTEYFTESYAVNEKPLAYADLDRDGGDEILVLTSSEPDEMGQYFCTLDVKEYDGTTLFTEEFATYHVGWNTLFLVYGEGKGGVWGADLLRYQPYASTGAACYSYDLLSLSDPTSRTIQSGSVSFPTADEPDTSPYAEVPPPEDFERFREDVTELLRGNATLLFSTDPTVCAGIADKTDGRGTEQAIENILSDLDANFQRLYPTSAAQT